jgi:FkbM family methyltransferase
MLTRKATKSGTRERTVLKRIFYFLLARFGVRRFKGHSFFGTLLTKPAVVADFGAHNGGFFAALNAEYPVSQALLVEADPVLADSLKGTFGNEADVLHAALIGENKEGTIIFTRSTEPEASSVFSERVAVYGVMNQVKVPTVDFGEALRHLGGRVDLAKLDIEGAEVGVLQTARPSDLAACNQLTVEFHDNMQPITRRDVDRICHRMRCEGYGIVNANWPYVDDVVFVNLRRIVGVRRLRFRGRMALVNALFVIRGAFFWTVRLLKRIRWNQLSLP